MGYWGLDLDSLSQMCTSTVCPTFMLEAKVTDLHDESISEPGG